MPNIHVIWRPEWRPKALEKLAGYGAIYQSAALLKVPDANLALAINDRRITVVVNMWSNPDSRLQEMCEYRHVPIPDGKRVDLLALSEHAVWASSRLANGQNILVQCHAGRNRSSLFSAFVLHQLLGWSGAYCVTWMQQRRPRALANPAMVEALSALPGLFGVLS